MAGIPRGFERYRPWWRGWYQGYGFNPVADLPGLAFYHDIKVQDSTFQGLPGMAYAINQNDGIGAVLDLRRYKERGANVVTQDGSAWTAAGSSPNQWVIDGDTAAIDNTGGTANAFVRHTANVLTAARLYEVTFTVLTSNGTGGVRPQNGSDNAPGYIAGTGTHTVLMRSAGAAPTQFQFQAFPGWAGSIDLSTIEVREIPGYHAIQAVAANQPVLNIENGIRSALFDGVDDRLVIPNSKGAFNFLHDGTGGEIHIACRLASSGGYLAGNSSINGNGFIIVLDGSRVRVGICNDTGVYVAEAVSPSGSLVLGEVAVFGFSFDGETLILYKNHVAIASTGITGTAPVPSDADYNLTIGSWQPDAGSFMHGDIYGVASAQGILTDYQRQRLATYMLRRAGA